jgi:hypothetical protein
MSSPQTPAKKSFFIMADTILNKLHNLNDIFYVGNANLASSAEFHIGGTEGNQLIVKNTDPIPTEFVMAGIFEID